MRTQRLNWMTSTALSLALAGCLQAEAIPLLDAGPNTPDTGVPDTGTEDMGEGDPSVHWPVVAHDFGRKMSEIYPCESALLWTFKHTEDSLGNFRNDVEVWAWEVGGTPQVLAANLSAGSGRLVGCHEGFAYWSEKDGEVWSLHRRSTTATGAAELVRVGARWFTWTMGDHGRVTRTLDDLSGIEVFDVDDSSVTLFPFSELLGGGGYGERASGDYLYVANSDGGGLRIAFTPGAEWSGVPLGFWFGGFAPVPGRLVGTDQSFNHAAVWQANADGTILRLAASCDGSNPTPLVSARAGWVLWNFVSTGGTGCMGVGRSTVDENGNVHSQPLQELTQWADEMALAAGDRIGLPDIRVIQFGAQIAFFDMGLGTIRLADEPAFPCVDPAVPCPAGGVCATTLCADLPN